MNFVFQKALDFLVGKELAQSARIQSVVISRITGWLAGLLAMPAVVTLNHYCGNCLPQEYAATAGAAIGISIVHTAESGLKTLVTSIATRDLNALHTASPLTDEQIRAYRIKGMPIPGEAVVPPREVPAQPRT